MSDISIIIPMRNEILHIKRAIESALKITNEVFVVDSNSTDGSIEVAKCLGVQVFQYEWSASSDFSQKINWALNNLPIKTKWIIRLDADEYFMENCISNLKDYLKNLPDNVNGCTLIRRVHFLGRWMKHSNEYPKTSLRVFRAGCVRMESRLVDEHIDLKGGKCADLPLDIVDDNLQTITQWVNKHNNNYSVKEAIELINDDIHLFNRDKGILDENAKKKREIKKTYSNMPMYWRCFVWFLYREFIKLGFLDGKEGFIWNFFQAWWYRTLVDIKIDEIYRECGKDKSKIFDYVYRTYKIQLKDE